MTCNNHNLESSGWWVKLIVYENDGIDDAEVENLQGYLLIPLRLFRLNQSFEPLMNAFYNLFLFSLYTFHDKK